MLPTHLWPTGERREGFDMIVAAAGSVPSFPTSVSFWWQALG